MFRLTNLFRLARRTPYRQLSLVTGQLKHSTPVILKGVEGNPRQTIARFSIKNPIAADECWNCQTVLPEVLNLFCSHCKVLQKTPTDLNHFEILGLTPEYPLETAQLTKQFRQLQSQLHPDKFSTKSPEEKSNSDDWSALVNRAYKTLLVPLTRAEYLLHLHGVEIPADNSALDAEFLIEMMEKNEEIEEADSEEMLLELLDKNKSEVQNLFPDLEAAFETGYFEQAVRTIIRLRYLYSIENSIKTKGQRMGFVLGQ